MSLGQFSVTLTFSPRSSYGALVAEIDLITFEDVAVNFTMEEKNKKEQNTKNDCKHSSRKLPIAVQTGPKLTSVWDMQRKCTHTGVWQSLQSPSAPWFLKHGRTHTLEKRKSISVENPSISTVVFRYKERFMLERNPVYSSSVGKAYNFHRHLKTHNNTQ